VAASTENLDPGSIYWAAVEPVWNTIDIYGGEERFLSTFASCNRDRALLFAAHWSQSEIFNGGFTQFFQNDTGVLAPEGVQGFTAIGMPRAARQIEIGMELLGLPFVRDRAVRMALIESILDREYEQRRGTPQKYGSFPYVEGWAPAESTFYECLAKENRGFKRAADAFALARRLSETM
jgi:hypothetical protein